MTGSLGAVRSIVIGASNPAATIAFLRVFGFENTATSIIIESVASEMYGLAHETTETTLANPSGGASLAIVATPNAGRARSAYQLGPRALDLYTPDIESALGLIAASGLASSISPIGDISLGPVAMRQALIMGPDGLPVVLVQSNMARSSVLDDHPESSFSDPHSVVWCVPERDSEAAWWQAQFELTKGMDLGFSEPAVSTYLGLPDPVVPIHMTMLSDTAIAPARLELLAFPEHPDASEASSEDADGPLTGGIWAIRLTDQPPARTDRSPGGVRYQH